jgi:hypothetical protein
MGTVGDCYDNAPMESSTISAYSQADIDEMEAELQTAQSNLSTDSYRLQQDQENASSAAEQCSLDEGHGIQDSTACGDESGDEATVSEDSQRVQNDESEIQNYQRQLGEARGDALRRSVGSKGVTATRTLAIVA